MSQARDSSVTTAPEHPRPRPWLKPLAWTVSLALLIAALAVVLSQRDALAAAARGLKSAPPGQLATLLILPLVSTVLTSLAFWQATRKYGRVGLSEMFALLSAAWVLNLLPLKPGLVGRTAYLARYNNISVANSIKILLETGAAGLAAVIILAYPMLRDRIAGSWIDFLGIPLMLALFALAAWGFARPEKPIAGFAAVTLLRMLDAFAWTLRYALILNLLGLPPDMGTAFLLAAAAQAAMYIPLVGNGLGVREWMVGATAAVAGNPGALTRDVFTRSMPVGISIDLVNRAAELVVLTPLGLACCAWTARLARDHEARLRNLSSES